MADRMQVLYIMQSLLDTKCTLLKAKQTVSRKEPVPERKAGAGFAYSEAEAAWLTRSKWRLAAMGKAGQTFPLALLGGGGTGGEKLTALRQVGVF